VLLHIPCISHLLEKPKKPISSFAHREKPSFSFLASVLMVVSAFSLIYMLNSQLIVAIPGYGGGVSEGIIGSPRFINPVLAISDADHDLSILIYSGLLRATPEGDYVPDLAENYTVSQDGLTYTFTLRKNATFHDGIPVTADDVVFTISKTQDPALKSPRARQLEWG
jgi:peptide/nickel transport system substrate-binding protein